MVEGHSVHRVATFHSQRLVGKAFSATSPNGRFADGAKAIDGKIFTRIEAVGKNLFAFFENVVVHVHFGMAGAWAVYENPENVPEPTRTNRLRLQGHGLTADLSAMTVNWGGPELYTSKREKLGHDPLRDDADPNALWSKVQASKKSIGALIMDQSYFTGPGNIYRAEILFKAGVNPDVPGRELDRQDFDEIWKHTVALLQRGYQTGSILTVDKEEAIRLGKPELRRYIYNTSKCPRCNSSIKTWDINNRTCYACPQCQPRNSSKPAPGKDHVPFNSHCAHESVNTRLEETGPDRLTVVELRDELSKRSIAFSSKDKKQALVNLLADAVKAGDSHNPNPIVSSEEAAVEKAEAKESLAVEHIAELAPAQARRARRRAHNQTVTPSKPNKRKKPEPALVTPPKRRNRKKLKM